MNMFEDYLGELITKYNNGVENTYSMGYRDALIHIREVYNNMLHNERHYNSEWEVL